MSTYLFPEQELQRRALSWAVRLSVNPATIRVERLGKKWGYCSSDGEVTLSRDLLDMSERHQDVVIVHELLHLRIRTHNRRFKALMSAHLPDWKSLEADLQRASA